jgi:hypothetical protein
MTRKDAAQIWGVITGILAAVSMRALFEPDAHLWLGVLGYTASIVILVSKTDSKESIDWWIGTQMTLIIYNCATG